MIMRQMKKHRVTKDLSPRDKDLTVTRQILIHQPINDYFCA